MRRLRLQMQVSVDGFVATGPDDDQRWVTWAWDEIRDDVMAIVSACDTILLGRSLAEGYLPYWASALEDPGNPMADLARHIGEARKVVFSRTLTASPWPDATIARGDTATEIAELKRRPGKDLVVYGGSSFVSSLIALGAIDEFHLFVNPVALGRGAPIFAGIADAQRLDLVRTVPYPSGIVLLTYRPR